MQCYNAMPRYWIRQAKHHDIPIRRPETVGQQPHLFSARDKTEDTKKKKEKKRNFVTKEKVNRKKGSVRVVYQVNSYSIAFMRHTGTRYRPATEGSFLTVYKYISMYLVQQY